MKKIITILLTISLASCSGSFDNIYGSNTNVEPGQLLSSTASYNTYPLYICNNGSHYNFQLDTKTNMGILTNLNGSDYVVKFKRSVSNPNIFTAVDNPSFQVIKENRNISIFKGSTVFTCSQIQDQKQIEAYMEHIEQIDQQALKDLAERNKKWLATHNSK